MEGKNEKITTKKADTEKQIEPMIKKVNVIQNKNVKTEQLNTQTDYNIFLKYTNSNVCDKLNEVDIIQAASKKENINNDKDSTERGLEKENFIGDKIPYIRENSTTNTKIEVVDFESMSLSYEEKNRIFSPENTSNNAEDMKNTISKYGSTEKMSDNETSIEVDDTQTNINHEKKEDLQTLISNSFGNHLDNIENKSDNILIPDQIEKTTENVANKLEDLYHDHQSVHTSVEQYKLSTLPTELIDNNDRFKYDSEEVKNQKIPLTKSKLNSDACIDIPIRSNLDDEKVLEKFSGK